MSKIKKTYFILLILSIVIVSIFYFSYAIFTSKIEAHGKLNIVAGTLDYKLESKYLKNNQIEIDVGDIIQFSINIISLNEVQSKYELYYKLPTGVTNVEIGYSSETVDNVKGIIGTKEENAKKEVKVIIKNKSNSKVKVTFGVHGGLSNLEFDDIAGLGNGLNETKIGDIILAWTYTGSKETPTAFPKQSEGYRVESVECNGVAAKFNNITWELSIPTTTGTITECNFTLVDLITMDTSTNLRIGDEVAGIDGSHWHVLEVSDGETETVTLLSDYNLNSDGTYNTECGANINNLCKCSVVPFSSDSQGQYDEANENNIGYLIRYIYAPQVLNNLPGTTNIDLPILDQIVAVDGKVFSYDLNHTSTNTSWLATTNYWLKTGYYSDAWRWIIYGMQSGWNISAAPVTYDDRAGVRPVITTPKTNLIAN